jgi:hypothetical protein
MAPYNRQEMFDLAWTGLKSQGWSPALEDGYCCYLTSNGLRCAYGHVETTLTSESGGVYLVASGAVCGDFAFARLLQLAHDLAAHEPGDGVTHLADAALQVNAARAAKVQTPTYKYGMMEANLRELARVANLTIPGE